MSTVDDTQPVTGSSRHSNGSNPASAGTAANTPEQESGARPSDLPTPEERIRSILDEYPDRAHRPLTETHGRRLREEALEPAETEEIEVPAGDGDTRTAERTVARRAVPWIAAVAEMLEWYEGYRDKYLRMARGKEWSEGREEFLVPMDNSFAPAYQKRQYARLKALKRQTAGESAEESPTGEEIAGAFEEPVTVLFGLTASGSEVPHPVEHDRAIRDAWGGSDGVRRTLRYVLQDRLGLSSDEYVWWFQSEPHPGGGTNAGLSHAHPVVVLDAAAADVELSDLDVETFRPVVAKHLAGCDPAGPEAHRIEEAVTVRKPGEIEDFAGYVSEYLALGPEKDLLERSDEYLLWAASQWATTTQKYSKSGGATAAIDADRCHQRYADPEADQGHDHGERITRSDGPGADFECAACGSWWEVSQEAATLVEARRDGDGAAEVRTDGGDGGPHPVERHRPGAVSGGLGSESGGGRESDESAAESDESAAESDTLRSRWPSARGAARVGAPLRERECDHAGGAAECPLCCPEGETVPGETLIPSGASVPDPAPVEIEGFVHAPSWEPDAVVQKASGEETPLGSPGGVEYGEVVEAGAGSVFAKVDVCLTADMLRGPEPWGGSDVLTERMVRTGEVPPPELVAREYAERHYSDRRVTRKEWPGDWYARRHDRAEADDEDGGEPDGPEVDRARVRRYVERHPSASVPAVLGALELSASARSVVEAVLDDW